jgi:hypothetical protein
MDEEIRKIKTRNEELKIKIAIWKKTKIIHQSSQKPTILRE